MKAITEQSIRMALLRKELKRGDTVVVDATTVVTPSAVSYMRENQLYISRGEEKQPSSTNLPALDRQVIQMKRIDCLVELLEMCYVTSFPSNAFFLTLEEKIKHIIDLIASNNKQSSIENKTDSEKRIDFESIQIDYQKMNRETIFYYRLFLKSSQVYLDLLSHDYNEVIVNETFDLVMCVINELEKKVK